VAPPIESSEDEGKDISDGDLSKGLSKGMGLNSLRQFLIILSIELHSQKAKPKV
jgi:hypothetical protein